MENVHYLTPEQLARWRQSKVINDLTEDIELDPVGGVPVITTLTADEQITYRELVIVKAGINEFTRDLSARLFTKTAEAINIAADPGELPKLMANYRMFENDAEAETFFTEEARSKYLESAFWYMLRNRILFETNRNTYGSRLGIRAGFTVVDLGKKYVR